MDLKSLTDKAKDMFTKRGGSDAAKEDFEELKDIAGKDEGLADKAKDAAAALKDPGAPGAPDAPATPPVEPPTEPPAGDRPAQP